MADDIRSFRERERSSGSEAIEQAIRGRVRQVIEAIVEEELESALGAGRSERRAGRGGYRHGRRSRVLTTSVGATSFSMPRARIREEAGGSREWRSRVVERYQRRTARVDEAILGVYLTGTNTRRLRGRCRRFCAVGRCRRTPSRGWSEGWPETSASGARGIFRAIRSSTC